jgi:hypothetical protein
MEVEINVGLVVENGQPTYLATVANGTLRTAAIGETPTDAAGWLERILTHSGYVVTKINHIER